MLLLTDDVTVDRYTGESRFSHMLCLVVATSALWPPGTVGRRSAVLGAASALTGLQVSLDGALVPTAAATTALPTWTLMGGGQMPTLALNTAGMTSDDTARALRLALPLGVTHVDFHPGRERDGVARVARSRSRTLTVTIALTLGIATASLG